METAERPPQEPLYSERHTFGILVLALIGILLALYLTVTIGALMKGEHGTAVLMSILTVVVFAIGAAFWRLTFTITADEITFGFPIYKKRFSRASLLSCAPYELKFSNYWGYGIRMGWDRTTAFNTRNGPGVMLVFEGARRPYVISVDEPAYICKLLGPRPGDSDT